MTANVRGDNWTGTGRPPAAIERPTLTIPADCLCTWTVVEAAPGYGAISALRYTHALCPAQLRHKPEGGK